MPRKPQPPAIDGILVVDKPRGKTSHDIVESVRRLVGFRQIGHLGTLDPLATGVLVLALGRATRLARFYAGRRKRYSCAVRFGFATDTYDADGEPLGADSAPTLDAEKIAALAAQFVGSECSMERNSICRSRKFSRAIRRPHRARRRNWIQVSGNPRLRVFNQQG